jgi:hypothetical protein
VRKKDLFSLVQPLLPRFYSLSVALLPDDLQAQQLVVDAMTLCLLKHKDTWLERAWDVQDRKGHVLERKLFMKTYVRHLTDLATKRAAQLGPSLPDGELVQAHPQFYRFDVRTRAVGWLRFQQAWSVDEIGRTLGMPRHEVIEKLHNMRYLMLGQAPHWMPTGDATEVEA